MLIRNMGKKSYCKDKTLKFLDSKGVSRRLGRHNKWNKRKTESQHDH